jgi:hypothetical protein
MTNAAEVIALNATFRANGTTYYIGLATAAILDTSTLATISEVTDTAYTRQVITFNAPVLGGDGKTGITNSATINFPAWAANQASPITYAFITTVPSAKTGDILAYFPLTTSISPTATQPASIASGVANIKLD